MRSLPAHSFDAVVFALVLCMLDEPEKTLAQARRLLRSGGKLVLLEHVRSHGALGTWQDRLQPIWGRVSGGCRLNRETGALVAGAGFDVSTLREERIAGGIVRDVLIGAASPAPRLAAKIHT
jgi:SAM-dependent methyltransferase